ncbi:MAG: PadR family transcriptional regulator [Desulfobacterales bacterium]|nr:PadR family transcriptional regulator [Desulfobacterales bacterium]
MDKADKHRDKPGSGKQERYIQPSVLLGLRIRSSYGYELIHNIQDFGFVEGQAPPGMIYRHLRQLEQDGLVVSEWKTEGTGPAKRMYSLTEDGMKVLDIWIDYMQSQAEKLKNFIKIYSSLNKQK